MTLLSALVVGPLTPLCRKVRVRQVLAGAEVEVLVNEVPFSPPAKATASCSEVTVVVPTDMVAGQSISARWTYDGQASGIPQAPGVGVVVVSPVPKTVPAPSFAIPVFDLSDVAVLSGVYPGATVAVYDGATVIGTAVADTDVVPVTLTASPRIGAIVTATQAIPNAPVSPPSTGTRQAVRDRTCFPSSRAAW